jgi:hypothetical protein
MIVSTLRVGDRVMVTAKDDFYAYIDGWRGCVSGFQNGLVWVVVDSEDIEKRFLVPSDELALTV